jgi:high affinity Mn2+ porin
VNIEPVIFRQYMAVGEVEGRYQTLGQPGVLKFLFFSDNGYFNKFDDVVALLYERIFPPSIDQ